MITVVPRAHAAAAFRGGPLAIFQEERGVVKTGAGHSSLEECGKYNLFIYLLINKVWVILGVAKITASLYFEGTTC